MVVAKKPCCGGWHWSMKIFFGLVGLFVIFVISVCIVMKREYRENRMMRNYGSLVMKGCTENGQKTMMRFDDQRGNNKVELVRLFGVVNKVEGNLITITTNAAAEQVVVSASDTVIMFGDKEVALSTLKEGDSAIFFGTMNAEAKLDAKVIKVQ